MTTDTVQAHTPGPWLEGEAKDIDPAALASITTGILMADFSAVHEAAEWLIGHPVWTHELPALADRLASLAIAQFPDLPTSVETTWQDTRDAVRIHYGDTVTVERGADQRISDPVTTLQSAISRATGQSDG